MATTDAASATALADALGSKVTINEKFYVTTAINYTNGPPHMGHAYEAVTTDILARYHRKCGRDVFFLTGADEHGQKVEQSASKMGRTPQEHADEYAAGFMALNKRLGISNDYYVRTSSKRHEEQVRKMWCKVRNVGDIYLTTYEGWYNVYEEQYVTETEAAATDFKDEHGRPYEKKCEESYFFRMSKYQERLIAHIKENPEFVQPAARRSEMLAFLSEPLRDLCISRTVCQWGVQCPEDPDYTGSENHVMYVWFDALTNYLTGIGYFEEGNSTAEYWPAVHIIGKDICRFHTIYWPCMLMSAGIPLPTCVFSHGFLNAEDGRKMSKSLGNVIDPNDVLDKFPADTFRFSLAKAATYGSDFPFGVNMMVSLHNAILKNGFGNLVSRGCALCKKYCEGAVPSESAHTIDGKLPIDVDALRSAFASALSVGSGQRDGLQIQVACEAVCAAIGATNQYLTDAAPWHMKGNDEETASRRRAVVRTVLEAVFILANFLDPFVPEGMKVVEGKLAHSLTMYQYLRPSFTNLVPGTKIAAGGILYEEVDANGVVKRNAGGKGSKKSSAKEDYLKAKAAKDAKKAALKKKEGPLFSQVDVRVGKIVKVWNHPESEKLFCEEIDVGEDTPRQIASGLRHHYSLEEMQDRRILVVCNLKPAKLAGFKSSGMVLCAKSEDGSKVEFVDAPDSAAIGERVSLPGFFDEYPPTSANQMKKKKVWDKVAPLLKTNDQRTVCFDGKPIATASGDAVTAPSLKDSFVS